MWAILIRFGQNQNLASQKISISYGYAFGSGVATVSCALGQEILAPPFNKT